MEGGSSRLLAKVSEELKTWAAFGTATAKALSSLDQLSAGQASLLTVLRLYLKTGSKVVAFQTCARVGKA